MQLEHTEARVVGFLASILMGTGPGSTPRSTERVCALRQTSDSCPLQRPCAPASLRTHLGRGRRMTPFW